MLSYVVLLLTLTSIAEAMLLYRLIRSIVVVQRVDHRLGRLTNALELLTETTELSFHSVAAELGRLREAKPSRPSSRSTTRRMTSALRQGRSLAEIAASEQVSEGEVRLRLHLADKSSAGGGNGSGRSDLGSSA